MLGFVIALVMFAWDAFINNMTITVAFLENADWLNTWYWIWGIVMTVLFVGPMLLGVLGVSVLGGAAAGSAGGKAGALVGALGGISLGGSFSTLIFGRFFLRQFLLLFGSFLLMTSGPGAETFSQFEMPRLIVGAVMVFVGAVLMRRPRSE